MSGPWDDPKCAHWIGTESRHCHTTQDVRPHLSGPCCPAHTPAALAGRPEAPETNSVSPSLLSASPLSASGVADARAIASGKRRPKSEAEYRAAQAAVAHKTD